MAKAIDKRIMLNLIIEAKKTDPKTGPFSEWLAEYLVDHLPTLTQPNEWVSDENFNQPLEKQYECTGGWKVSDPKTRPFKFSNEMEDWEYHG